MFYIEETYGNDGRAIKILRNWPDLNTTILEFITNYNADTSPVKFQKNY
jgi:hypothetical protein